MSEQDHESKERYQRARTGFDELETDQKVIFLMEAAVSTAARGIDAFGRAVSQEINNAFSKRAHRKEAPEEPEEPMNGTSDPPSTGPETEGSEPGGDPIP